MSWCGTRPLAIIHSPVRTCQPVSPSPSMPVAPPMRRNRNTMGMRNAASVSDGSRRTAKCGLGASILIGQCHLLNLKISYASFYFFKLRQRVRIFCEFHLIHAKRYAKRLALLAGYAHHGRLTVNAFSAEDRIFWQLD